MIKIGAAISEAAEQLEKEKGIPKDVFIRSLSDAMVTAYKKHIRSHDVSNVEALIDESKGEIGVFRCKRVVDEVLNELAEVNLEDARKINPETELDDDINIDVTPADFGRIAAQAAKQVITQRIREAERQLILEEFVSKKGSLVTGLIQRVEPRNVVVNIGRTEAVLPSKEQVPGEYYRVGERIRIYILDVRETTRLPQVVVSQVHPRIVQELFELEVPEIEDGIVEIKSISREAGFRTKIAVSTNDPEVDPVGACIGPRGARIQTIVNELKNEKIDIIRYSEDPVEYIINALSPARIISVEIVENSDQLKAALIVVPDDQLSLAIGKEGQNVRLAHKLTSWKLDIKSYSQIESEEGDYYQESGDYAEEYDETLESESTEYQQIENVTEQQVAEATENVVDQEADEENYAEESIEKVDSSEDKED